MIYTYSGRSVTVGDSAQGMSPIGHIVEEQQSIGEITLPDDLPPMLSGRMWDFVKASSPMKSYHELSQELEEPIEEVCFPVK